MSDVSVTITGDVPMKAIGCSITYGYNRIPEARINLDPTDKDNANILCNVDSFRRKVVKIKIQSTKGCINFDGLFDGLSISQAVGSFNYQAVVKSKYQLLLETYPTFPGLNPISQRVFRRNRTTTMEANFGSGKLVGTVAGVPVGDNNIIEFFIECIRAAVTRQTELTAIAGSNISLTSPLLKLINDKKYQENTKKSIALLSTIDSSAIKDLKFSGGGGVQYQMVYKLFTNSASSIWEWFINGMEAFNCVAVVANNKIFVLPQNQFIKMPHTVPDYKSTKAKNNVALPSQFNSFSLNDSGYKDIGSCAIVSDFSDALILNKGPGKSQLGIYQDDAASSSGIYVGEGPNILSLALRGQVQQTTTTLVTDSGTKVPRIKATIDKDSPINRAYAAGAVVSKTHAEDQKFFDNLAQVEYYRIKYTDRMGGVSMEFTPNWAPGTSGTLYTRYPGLFLDFYVAGVTHDIEIGPNTARATTSVSFSSGRVGKDPVGVDTDVFFKYTQANMIAQQDKFIKEISS